MLSLRALRLCENKFLEYFYTLNPACTDDKS